MTRSELAEAANEYLWRTTGKRYALDAHTIARYERGKVHWPSAVYRAGLKAVLAVDRDADLGFHPARRGSSTASPPQPGTNESGRFGSPAAGRRSLVTGHGASEESGDEPTPDRPGSSGAAPLRSTSVGIGGHLDLGQSPAAFLADTAVEPSVSARVGWTDVEYVRGATRAIAMSENVFGGGLCCEAASSQLCWVGALLEAQAANDVRTAMYEAVGNLSSVVAYSAFDIANFAVVDRYFRFALWCAE